MRRILFLMAHQGHVRNFESVLLSLASRGHRITLGFPARKKIWATSEVRLGSVLAAENPNIDLTAIPIEGGDWVSLAWAIRMSVDLCRYYQPPYADAHYLRHRIDRQMPRWWRWPLRGFLTASGSLGARGLRRALRACERAIPTTPSIVDFIGSQSPDAVLVTPLVTWGSEQVEYVKAAQALGVPVGLCVSSWDNLTNKGLMRVDLDRVFVWNDAQKAEAVHLHDVPTDRVAVTGAHCFDKWFDRKPSRSREEFCGALGLDASRPFFLYLCSSQSISGDREVAFVREWIRALRGSSHAAVSAAGILIRPHPQNAEQWAGVDLSGEPNIAVHPREGAVPERGERLADYFDALFHCAGVVGLNTSAQIEAGIVGRPVYTVLREEFRTGQEATLHFHHLVREGLLNVTRSFDDHAADLSRLLSAGEASGDAREGFLRSFVRPKGLDRPSTPVAVEEIEALASSGREGRQPAPARGSALTIVLWPVAGLLKLLGGVGRREEWSVKLEKRLVARHATPQLPPATGAGGQAAPRPAIAAGLSALVQKHVAPPLIRLAGLNGDVIQSLVQAKVDRSIDAIASRTGAVLVGPWLSEVGFEILYWIPFLRRATGRHPSLSDRMIVLSRGGTRDWYRGIAKRYVDLLDLMSLEEYRALNEHRYRESRAQKQMEWGALDQDMVERAQKHLGLLGCHVLHPRSMYAALQPFWRGDASLSRLEECVRYEPLGGAAPPAPAWLPEDYVAARFYFRPSFPDTPENRAFVNRLLERLTRRTNVVLLDHGHRVDEHVDCPIDRMPRVFDIRDRSKPEDNLHLQTQVLRNAKAFFGTYGGLTHLALFAGVPAVGFFSEGQHLTRAHLDVSYRVARALNVRHVALDTRDIALLETLLEQGALEPETGVVDAAEIPGVVAAPEEGASQTLSRWDAVGTLTDIAHVRSEGLEYFVSTRDQTVGRAVYENGGHQDKYLRRAVAILAARNPRLREGVFVDVGANVGTTVIPAVKRHGFSRALAVEPDPSNFKLLQLNCVANGIAGRVSSVNAALTDREGPVALALSESNHGDHRVVFGAGAPAAGGRQIVTVPGVTLMSLLEQRGIDPAQVTVVWMDTQGHEGHVLSGAGERFLASGVPLCLELWPHGLGLVDGVERLLDALRTHYSHFVDLRRVDPRRPELIPMSQIESLVERLGDASHTDILALRTP